MMILRRPPGPLDHVNRLLAKPALFSLSFALTYIAAWFSDHLYEKHFLALKRFFEYGGRPGKPDVSSLGHATTTPPTPQENAGE